MFNDLKILSKLELYIIHKNKNNDNNLYPIDKIQIESYKVTKKSQIKNYN